MISLHPEELDDICKQNKKKENERNGGFYYLILLPGKKINI